jgi:hypothetical protein
MSRLVVLLAIVLGACGACSRESNKPKKEGTASTKKTPGGVVEMGKGGGEFETPDGSGESFELTLDHPAAVAPGSEAVARLVIVPKGAYHINQEFPTELTLTPPDGVKLEKTEYALEDAEKVDDNQLVFAIKATPATAGSFQVDGKIKFAVCLGEEDCEPKRRQVSFTVAAQ